MPLPDFIEIVPLDKPVRAEITVPGSKSITNRALILAALADGEIKLKGALWSEDTQIMVKALKKLGFKIIVSPDPNEFCNRTITVNGMGGKIPKRGGTASNPLKLSVGNAGTAARFLTAFVCLGKGVYRLEGVSRMRERPQAGLFNALRKPKLHELVFSRFFPSLQKLGYHVVSRDGKLPMDIYGDGPKPGKCTVSIEESSQFASALLLCAKVGGWKVEVVGENAEESPYVAMTSKMVEAFPKNGGTFQIEPDASSGSYFLAAHQLQNYAFGFVGDITVKHWPKSGWQIDEGFPRYLKLPKIISRVADLGDSILTAFILAPFAEQPVIFKDLERIRVQESDRHEAMFQGLQHSGVMPLSGSAADSPANFKPYVSSGDNALIIGPLASTTSTPTPIDPRNDHRIAMCFAILGLKVPGIKIKNPACVKKTFPNFFQKLATPPPKGLGATILDAKTGRKLGVEELFAD